MSDQSKLPDEFSDLQPLADRFALGDDMERGSAVEQASQEEKRRLVEAVKPRFDAINAYLDHHDDDQAHVLGRLAEAAAEVAIELDR